MSLQQKYIKVYESLAVEIHVEDGQEVFSVDCCGCKASRVFDVGEAGLSQNRLLNLGWRDCASYGYNKVGTFCPACVEVISTYQSLHAVLQDTLATNYRIFNHLGVSFE